MRGRFCLAALRRQGVTQEFVRHRGIGFEPHGLLQLRHRLRQLPDIQQGDTAVLVRFGRWRQPQRGFVVDQSFGGPALE